MTTQKQNEQTTTTLRSSLLRSTSADADQRLYDKLRRPPEWALKKIKGGRLSGMTDVNPQWRIEALTRALGPVGFGWRWEEVERWTAEGGGETACFVKAALYVKIGDEWSAPIYGVGGNKLVMAERNGARLNDEAWKMAVTDALSTAMKMLGVAADIYAGRWDGSKYLDIPDSSSDAPVPREAPAPPQQPAPQPSPEHPSTELETVIREKLSHDAPNCPDVEGAVQEIVGQLRWMAQQGFIDKKVTAATEEVQRCVIETYDKDDGAHFCLAEPEDDNGTPE